MAGRYKATGPEAEFQPGSRGRVLRNRLGITSVRELERRESAALRFTAGEIRRMHLLWLGEIYEWAGEYRGVNIASRRQWALRSSSRDVDGAARVTGSGFRGDPRR